MEQIAIPREGRSSLSGVGARWLRFAARGDTRLSVKNRVLHTGVGSMLRHLIWFARHHCRLVGGTIGVPKSYRLQSAFRDRRFGVR